MNDRIVFFVRDASLKPATSKFKFVAGLMAVIFFILTVLILCFHAAEKFYSSNMMYLDGVLQLIRVLRILRISSCDGYVSGIQGVEMEQFSLLHQYVAAFLAPVLPMNSSIAVILNGIWLLLLGVSSYILVFHWTRSSLCAFLLTVPLIVLDHTLYVPQFGIFDLRLDILAYTIGGSAICFLMLSEGFRNKYAAVAAGSFATFLIYGRIFQIALFALGCLPLIFFSYMTAKRKEKRTIIMGITIFAVIPLALAGWWVVELVSPTIDYFAKWHGYGRADSYLIGSSKSYFSITLYLYFALIQPSLLITSQFPFYPIVYGWRFGGFIKNDIESWGKFFSLLNWPLIGFFIVPWAAFIILRSTYYYYAIGTAFPFILFLFFPFLLRAEAVEELRFCPKSSSDNKNQSTPIRLTDDSSRSQDNLNGTEGQSGSHIEKRLFLTILALAAVFSFLGFTRNLKQLEAIYTSGDKYIYEGLVDAIYSNAKERGHTSPRIHIFNRMHDILPYRFAVMVLENTDCPLIFDSKTPGREIFAPGRNELSFSIIADDSEATDALEDLYRFEFGTIPEYVIVAEATDQVNTKGNITPFRTIFTEVASFDHQGITFKVFSLDTHPGAATNTTTP